MSNTRVQTKSGLTGWQGRLQDQYECKSEFVSCDGLYGLASRLGFDDPERAWNENPMVQGSVNPDDYCRVSPVLTRSEASQYGDPALRDDRPRPLVWVNGCPHIIRGVTEATPTIGDVLVLAVLGRHGSRILISRPDSETVSEALRRGSLSIELDGMHSA